MENAYFFLRKLEMPKEKRGKILEALAATRPVAEARNSLAGLTILRKTATQYASALSSFLAWLRLRKGISEKDQRTAAELATCDDFIQFLDAAQLSGLTVSATFRSALLKQQQCLGLPTWAANSECIVLFKGFRYNGGKNRGTNKIRGTVTPQMLNGLVEYTRKQHPEMVDAILVQFGCALRVSQLINIVSGDLNTLVEPPRLTIRVDKRQNANNIDNAERGCHLKEVLSPEATEVLLRLQTSTPATVLLFPPSKWKRRDYVAHLKKAAVALQWPPELKWDGSHVLRHGGTRVLVERAQVAGRNAEVACVMSAPTVRRYSQSLEDRIQKQRNNSIGK